ncbi:30S ribosome-binding factor RbfA [Azospirillum doebereinerae]|uniref:30S ribosome-binding factor RbfA n=1 Tax=Azospirillum doebereinerae TaxID=92933 RepID=UPI001EE571B5|nr:30S ribosome-binding factor RbfA [Azospirillum doebereinerae]MCG5243942.1 30S ribosome-binding factor RbfA [Azospirillum doebereinerae]
MANKKRGAINAGKPPSQRQLRVGEELRHALADLFRRGDFHDPELSALNLTVTEVRVSPDLSNATVFFSTLGGGQMEEAKVALRRASAFLRGQVARLVNLRHAPTLSFEIDTSFEYAHHIDNILHSPAVARDLSRVNGDDDHDEDEDEDDSWDEDEDDDASASDEDDAEDDEAGNDEQDKGGRRGS